MGAEGNPGIQYLGEEDHEEDRIAILVARWHSEITETLYQGAVEVLQAYGVQAQNIERYNVPGSYELPMAAGFLAATRRFDAILAFGVVVKGATRHDEYINHAVSSRLLDVSLQHHLPVLLGVLTVETLQQAIERAQGPVGYKGQECAVAALEMIDLMRETQDF
jgi:6,7-dimethyl-8-ribityllumazine synthase